MERNLKFKEIVVRAGPDRFSGYYFFVMKRLDFLLAHVEWNDRLVGYTHFIKTTKKNLVQIYNKKILIKP